MKNKFQKISENIREKMNIKTFLMFIDNFLFHSQISEKEIKSIKKLLNQVQDIPTKKMFSFVMICIKNNKSLQISQETWSQLFERVDLKKYNESKINILMSVLSYYKIQSLNFSENQWDYLIQNSDLKLIDHNHWNVLKYALGCNEGIHQSFRLTEKQWDYLIENSDLKEEEGKVIAIDHYNFFMLALLGNNDKNWNSSKYPIVKLWNLLSQEEQQKTFREVCTQYQIGKLEKEKILFILYDLQFEPDKNTKHYIKIISYQEIVEMIEKKDFFYQLHQNLKPKEEVLTIYKNKI